MPFNINSFKAEIANYGYIQNNKFQLYVAAPPILTGTSISSIQDGGVVSVDVGSITQRLLMRAQNVIAPGFQLNLSEVNRFGYGISQKQPFNSSVNNMTLTFICDGRGSIWQFWYQWLRSIFQFSGIDNGTGTIFNDSGSYLIQYKDSYSTTLSIVMYDNSGKIVQTNNYTEAFPYGINDTVLSWDTDNQLMSISVAVAFTDYTIQTSSLTNKTVDNSIVF